MDGIMSNKKPVRVVTNEDIRRYVPMVEKYLRDSVIKNWNEATLNKDQNEVTLGNTGLSMADIRQHLLTELVVALQKFDPNYITKPKYKTVDGEEIEVDPGGKTVKESTFVYQHLFNRCGQLMKKLTKRRYGYGIWHSDLNDVIRESDNNDY
jgi:hypothetical protein